MKVPRGVRNMLDNAVVFSFNQFEGYVYVGNDRATGEVRYAWLNPVTRELCKVRHMASYLHR